MAPPTVSELISGLAEDQFVTIKVGNKAKAYKVQRMILTNASSWFVKALNERFKEGKQLELHFPGTDPQVLEYFLYYLIRGSAPLNSKADNGSKDSYNQLLAVRIWVFGDQHFLPGLQNEAMRHLHTSFRANIWPEVATVREAIDSTTSESALRRYMIAKLVAGLRHKGSSLSPHQKGYDLAQLQALDGLPGLAVDLGKEIMRDLPSSKPSSCPISDYLLRVDDTN
ncbi:hypothetical protein LTR37_019604 [Vermiconidia calcicola]|uniref:Uncharacterized protein n=1 Tax=Vermiconidia calcicola TaxID=1690605 RepID=A0ACC3MF96_9PEZI|nr:hypothetical protein LTR37_019604 [Vermiconidia calcicola]